MQRLTVSLDDRHVYELKAQQRLGNADSRSAAVRHILDQYAELQAEYEELHTEYEQTRGELEGRKERVETLEEQLAKRQQIEQKIDDLPDKVRTVGTYQERRQRLLDQASFTERLKWKVTGVPADRLDADE